MNILEDALIEIESDDDHDLTGLISWNLHHMHKYDCKELTEFLLCFMASINEVCDDEESQWIIEEFCMYK